MKILAINTVFMNADISVCNDQTEECVSMDSHCKHSENLLVTVDSVLNKINTEINDIDYISVVVGPGSFTGLRIAVATAKALLVTNNNMKAVSINSLELLAYSYFKKHNENAVCVLLNALSGFYFYAEYDKNLNVLTAPTMITKDNFDILINKTIISNEALEIIDNEIVDYNPQDLLEYSKILIKKERFCEEKNLLPLYIRASQAEDNLKKRKK